MESETDFTTVFARLLTERSFREEFVLDRGTAIAQMNLPPGDIEGLMKLDASAVCRQADALINKRFRHVRTLLPRTYEFLGDEAQQLFESYATQYWPKTHQRHLLDALQFSKWLVNRRKPTDQAEINRLKYQLTGQRWSFYWLTRHRGRRRLGLQLLYRRSNFREWIISFGI